MFEEAKLHTNNSAYIVLFVLNGKLRKFFLAGNEINKNPDFVEENRMCSNEEVIVLHNNAQNQKCLMELVTEIQPIVGKRRN